MFHLISPLLRDQMKLSVSIFIMHASVPHPALSYGIICVAMAYIVHLMNSSVLQAALSIFGMVGGPLLGLFCLGIFFPCANSIGAVIGLAAGLIMSFWVGIGGFLSRMPSSVQVLPLNSTNTVPAVSGNITVIDAASRPVGLNGLYSLSYMWYSALNSSTVVLIGLLISFMTGPTKGDDVASGTVYPVMRTARSLVHKLVKPSACCTSPPEHTIDDHKEINGNITEDAGTEEETETFLPSNAVSPVEHETSV